MNGDAADPIPRVGVRVRRVRFRRLARRCAPWSRAQRRSAPAWDGMSSDRISTSTCGRAGFPSTGATAHPSITRSADPRRSNTPSTTRQIAQFAAAIGDQRTARTLPRTRGNWRHLLNPVTHWLSARRADGGFPPGPAFQGSPLPGIGQDGWEEGNSIQYSWSVPQDLRGLFDAMGGNAVVVARLDSLLHPPEHQSQATIRLGRERARARYPVGVRLRGRAVAHAGRRAAYRDGALPRDTERRARQRRPRRALLVVRLGRNRLVSRDTGSRRPRAGEPDVHTRLDHSWFRQQSSPSPRRRPLTPTVTCNAPASPASPRRRRAPTPRREYVCPWLPASVLTSGGTLDLTLAATPDKRWGSAPSAAPPSISSG